MKRIFQNKTQSHEEQAKKSVKKQPQQQINIANVQRAIEDPTNEALDAETMLAIQQTHGNQFASQLTSPVQAKLTVTEANDSYEQEADAVAQQVVLVCMTLFNAKKKRNLLNLSAILFNAKRKKN